MLSQTGCLLGETPEYQSRRQTLPVLLTPNIDPPINQVIRVRTDESVNFKVTYRSEDAGDRMSALLYRNYVKGDPETGFLNKAREFPPSSNLYPDEGPPSEATIAYTFRNEDLGCHSYTMLLTHKSNLGDENNLLKPVDDKLVVQVTWWAAVVNQSGEPADISVDQCGEQQQ